MALMNVVASFKKEATFLLKRKSLEILKALLSFVSL
jgi:hypothetical protein